MIYYVVHSDSSIEQIEADSFSLNGSDCIFTIDDSTTTLNNVLAVKSCSPSELFSSSDFYGWPLDSIKDFLWANVKLSRESMLRYCMTSKGVIDIDPESKTNIAGCVQMALIAKASGQPFSVSWTMSDNSIQVHNADEMIAMGVTVGQRVYAVHAYSQSLRSRIFDSSITTSEQLINSVNINEGWP